MKRIVLLLLSLAPLAFAASTPATKSAPPVAKEFAPIVDDPKLPRVLIIGDSVSVAYTLDVRKNLAGVANVHRIPTNGGSTRTALGEYGLIRWLKPGEKWDVIHFNEGLHDLSYRFPDDRDKNDKGEYASPTNGGRPNVSVEQYEKNLRLIVARLKQTGAKLIWTSTTPIPDNPAQKQTAASVIEKNALAAEVMKKHGIPTDDLFSAMTPRLAEFQPPLDVHFTGAGYDFLGATVGEAILSRLK